MPRVIYRACDICGEPALERYCGIYLNDKRQYRCQECFELESKTAVIRERRLNKRRIVDLSKKEDKSKAERELICNNCAWAYGKGECVRNGDCDAPKLDGFKPNWIWKLFSELKTAEMEINGKVFEYSEYHIEKREGK